MSQNPDIVAELGATTPGETITDVLSGIAVMFFLIGGGAYLFGVFG